MNKFGFGSVTCVVSLLLSTAAAGDDALKPPRGYVAARISVVDADGARSAATLTRGARERVLPGARGYLVSAAGAKIAGSEFAVELVTASSARAPIALGVSEVQAAPAAYVEAAHCTFGPETPRLTRDVVAGKSAPEGWTMVGVLDVAASDGDLTITLARGTASGVLPGSKAYLATPGAGAPLGLPVSIVRATARTAVAIVPGVKRPIPGLSRLGVQLARCTGGGSP